MVYFFFLMKGFDQIEAIIRDNKVWNNLSNKTNIEILASKLDKEYQSFELEKVIKYV